MYLLFKLSYNFFPNIYSLQKISLKLKTVKKHPSVTQRHHYVPHSLSVFSNSASTNKQAFCRFRSQ